MTGDARARRLALASFIAVTLAAVTWARLWLVDHLHDQGWFTKYVVFADEIRAGHIPYARIGDVSPAYLWLMVALRALGTGVHGLRVLQVIALTLAALFCALAAHRLGGWIAALTTALLILGNRAALVLATEIEPETLILLLTSAAIAVLVARRRFAPALLGLLVGLSAIARPVALLLLVLLVAWMFFRESRRDALLLAGAAAVPIVTILLVNASLTGSVFIMQPGAQFYEGNNPLATSCAGVLPRIVADLDTNSHEPDYLHVAYRLIAARATNTPIDARRSNRYWSAKAFAFLRDEPRAALALFAWKGVLAVHHYDVWDLYTMRAKAIELARYPAIPFGAGFVLAVAAFALRRDRARLLPIAFFAVSTFAALVLFNVSARQRNALLPPLAVLGGAGVAEIVALARTRPRADRALLAFGAVIIAIPLLGIEGNPMREYEYDWWSWTRAYGLRDAAYRARAAGDRVTAARFAATASVLEPGEEPLVSAPTLRSFALADLAANAGSDQHRFDAAVALEKAGAWREADTVLATLDDYTPRRENRAVSSVAYYRARAALATAPSPPPAISPAVLLSTSPALPPSRPPAETLRRHLTRALAESRGDPYVLALAALTLSDSRARAELDALYDPFTRGTALAAAYQDLGDTPRARALLAQVAQRFPEWRRPVALLATMPPATPAPASASTSAPASAPVPAPPPAAAATPISRSISRRATPSQ